MCAVRCMGLEESFFHLMTHYLEREAVIKSSMSELSFVLYSHPLTGSCTLCNIGLQHILLYELAVHNCWTSMPYCIEFPSSVEP